MRLLWRRLMGKLVAWTAAAEDWFMPMKKKENAEVEGSPPRIPPTTLPFFSATTVMAITHKLPTAKAKRRWVSIEASIICLTCRLLG